MNAKYDENFKAQLKEFKNDHDRHVQELKKCFEQKNETPPLGPSPNQWLTKGKVFMANLLGDKTILIAMSSNESDTNTAYESVYPAFFWRGNF